MGDTSKHTDSTEWRCKCGCGLYRPGDRIIQVMEFARCAMNIKYYYMYMIGNFPIVHEVSIDELEIKLHISSGTRCQSHNDRPQSEGGAGGSKNSQHIVTVYGDSQGGKVYSSSNACDGWFYFGDDYNVNRVDASEVLIRMYQDEIINGLILYRGTDCKTCKGTGIVTGYSHEICDACGGDGEVRDYRFHVDVGERRFFKDRR